MTQKPPRGGRRLSGLTEAVESARKGELVVYVVSERGMLDRCVDLLRKHGLTEATRLVKGGRVEVHFPGGGCLRFVVPRADTLGLAPTIPGHAA